MEVQMTKKIQPSVDELCRHLTEIPPIFLQKLSLKSSMSPEAVVADVLCQIGNKLPRAEELIDFSVHTRLFSNSGRSKNTHKFNYLRLVLISSWLLSVKFDIESYSDFLNQIIKL